MPLNEVITGGFYPIGVKVLGEQETANCFKTAAVLQMVRGEVREQYPAGRRSELTLTKSKAWDVVVGSAF